MIKIKNTVSFFSFLAIFLFSCANEPQKKEWDFRKPEKIEENYWNNYRLTQKNLESCNGVYFPGYFPMSTGYGKLIKKIIPGDTILYFDLEMQQASRKNGSAIYYFVDKKTKFLFNGGEGDVPFLTGIFSCDSNQNLLWEDLALLKNIKKPSELEKNPNIYFGMGVSPCLLAKEFHRPVTGDNWKFGILQGPVYDTIRFNRDGAEINPLLLKEYKGKLKYKQVNNEDEPLQVLKPVEEFPCIKLDVYYAAGNYSVWFQRNIGPVKIECRPSGIIYYLGRNSAGYSNDNYTERENNFGRY